MPPSFQEAPISQIPALRMLQQLGYSYLTPEECAVERKGKFGRVLLEGVLAGQLKRLNKISVKGRELPFTDENIAAILDQQKRGLMQRLLTGKLRVKVVHEKMRSTPSLEPTHDTHD